MEHASRSKSRRVATNTERPSCLYEQTSEQRLILYWKDASTVLYTQLLYWRDASHNTLDYCIGGMHLTIY